MRKLMFLLAFLAAFGQALAGASFAGTPLGELGHVLAHAQDDGHHHHDDGGMHVDEAGDGAFHVHLDGANSAAPPAAPSARAALALPQGPPDWEARERPSPTIDGLLRPPKLAS
ncbi:hypothetical protein FN976_17130 [Caenimonas sedimenti]|uniref:Cobalt transporter n=1 Tax=Caenimonas sedimenti TaxID=2596921 RepID=A0A562ZN98_9BURK|nr:hypothetical protein [Caenimonas sedimenti]TWO70059.1 hypothetical protein FN976_17130 [Caenimonas sedimenti]